MSFQQNPFKPHSPYKHQIHDELLQANENFNVLAQSYKNNDPNTGIVKHAILADYADICGDADISSPLQIPYSRLYIQSGVPDSPNTYDSWYDLDSDNLYFFNCKGEWRPVNWRKFVSNEPGFMLGRAYSIRNNKLCVYDKVIYPSVGRLVEVVADDTNPNDDFKIVFLSFGQSLLVRNGSKIRVSTVAGNIWQGHYYFKGQGSNGWFGILPNDEIIANGSAQVLIGDGNVNYGKGSINAGITYYTDGLLPNTGHLSAYAYIPVDNTGTVRALYTQANRFVPIMYQATDVNFGNFSIALDHDYYQGDQLFTTGMGHTLSSIAGGFCTGSGSLGSSIWYMGSFCSNGSPIEVDYAVITRVY
ncbi:MAG: hypothetical protein JHC33_03745 [Ignisphaera sp.]|nr:hypothetical protein [Ignisphaera sp.]